MNAQHYSPSIWAQQPLHPPPKLLQSQTKECLDWIFLVSALNFSFWSELEGLPTRYGVIWRKSWNDTSGQTKKWEGYYSLLAALNKGMHTILRSVFGYLTRPEAIENGIPITDPCFYASETACPDSTIKAVFGGADGCAEPIPLLEKRVAIMREVGKIFMEVSDHLYIFHRNSSRESRLENPRAVLYGIIERDHENKPELRELDSHPLKHGRRMLSMFSRRIYLQGKISSLLETCTNTYCGDMVLPSASISRPQTGLTLLHRAAFYPEDPLSAHPFLPDGVDILTMFADYRVSRLSCLYKINCSLAITGPTNSSTARLSILFRRTCANAQKRGLPRLWIYTRE